MTAVFAAVAFAACLVGKICGMGGGILIKPVLDASGLLSVAAINFISACTVAGMSLWSVGKGILQKDRALDFKISTPLAAGSAAGGILGRLLFRYAAELTGNAEKAGVLQAALLFAATLATLLYTLKKDRLRSYRVSAPLSCVLIGLFLGALGAFLGVGGGPFNMAVLFFFFSMTAKTAAKNSLYIILISQAAAILYTVISGEVPSVEVSLLLLMIGFGILGSEAGSRIGSSLSEKRTLTLFLWVMVLVMGICLYNILRAY